jgi:hypothetical protein
MDFIEKDIIDKYRRRRGINESNERSGIKPKSSFRSLGDNLSDSIGFRFNHCEGLHVQQGRKNKNVA